MNKIESEEIKRVFVTGGTGFVGKAVITELLSRSYSITALANHGQFSSSQNAKVIKGDLFNSGRIVGRHARLPGSDSSRRNHRRATLQRRDLPTNPCRRNQSHRRCDKEGGASQDTSHVRTRQPPARGQHVPSDEIRSGTICRRLGSRLHDHSPIAHSRPGRCVHENRSEVGKGKPPRHFFAMPYFGAGWLGRGGAGMLQPVFVNDVARAFVDALENSTTCKQIYPLGGSEQLTWPQMHETVATKITGPPPPHPPLPSPHRKILRCHRPRKTSQFQSRPNHHEPGR